LLSSTAAVATAVDKSPAYARLSTVASAGDLPTAPTPTTGDTTDSIFGIELTRAPLTPYRLDDALVLQIAGPDLIRRAGNDLLRREILGLDRAARCSAVAPFSQELEPPANPERFTRRSGVETRKRK
jgi:hypothetical protein